MSVCELSLQPVEKVTMSDTSSEVKARPVWKSVNRMGSKSTRLVGASCCTQVSWAGDEQSLKVVNRVWTSDWVATSPVNQSTPIEGSPAVVPRPPGAW